MVNSKFLTQIITNKGNDLNSLSTRNPVLLVFLRHFGCVFCRESLRDLKIKRKDFEKEGIKLVFVHMAQSDVAEEYFETNGLKNIEHIADPDCKLYLSFGLTKGTVSQLFGLKTWIRTVEVAATKQIFPTSKTIGDGLQMPGIFLLKEGQVVESFIHKAVSDKPDYETFIQNCAI